MEYLEDGQGYFVGQVLGKILMKSRVLLYGSTMKRRRSKSYSKRVG